MHDLLKQNSINRGFAYTFSPQSFSWWNSSEAFALKVESLAVGDEGREQLLVWFGNALLLQTTYEGKVITKTFVHEDAAKTQFRTVELNYDDEQQVYETCSYDDTVRIASEVFSWLEGLERSEAERPVVEEPEDEGSLQCFLRGLSMNDVSEDPEQIFEILRGMTCDADSEGLSFLFGVREELVQSPQSDSAQFKAIEVASSKYLREILENVKEEGDIEVGESEVDAVYQLLIEGDHPDSAALLELFGCSDRNGLLGYLSGGGYTGLDYTR